MAAGKKTTNSTRSIIIPILIVVALAALAVGGRLGLHTILTPDIDEKIARHAEAANKDLPMLVNADTRLDEIIPGESKSFSYKYTLVNAKFSELDPFQFRAVMKPRVVASLKQTSEMHYLFKEDVTVSYTYYDKEGTPVARFDITREDLGL